MKFQFILDTNIFYSNWLFIDENYKAFLNYLKRSNSVILMPPVVWEEIQAKYGDSLKEYIRTTNEQINTVVNKKHVGNINKMLAEGGNYIANYDPISVDISVRKSDYVAYIKKLLQLAPNSFLPYPTRQDILPHLVKNALDRQRPFSKSGEGFRDALIWENIIEKASQVHDQHFVLISNDGNDKKEAGFGTGENGIKTLHPDLLEDWRNRGNGNEISYYDSIQSFIIAHKANLEYVNKEYAERLIDKAFNGSAGFAAYLDKGIRENLGYNYTSRRIPWDPNIPNRPTHVYYQFSTISDVQYLIDDNISDYDYGNNKIHIQFAVNGTFSTTVSGTFGPDYSYVEKSVRGRFSTQVILIKQGESVEHSNYGYAVSLDNFRG